MERFQHIQLPDSRIFEVQIIEDGYYEKGKICVTDLPRVCRVVFKSSPTVNSLIISELWMPDEWNGIFIGLGNGGVGGSINGEFWEYAKQGYAVAQTDMGTSLVVANVVKKASPDLWKDYGWRSTHLMTVVSKCIIEKYYGRKPEYSYFFGESAGGLQAFSEAQRYPGDYNGILAGVPSSNALYLVTYFLWLYIKLRTDDGQPVITRKESDDITACATEFFQQHGDGEAGDDFITYPYINETTIEDFLLFLKEKHPYFTEQQMKALEAVYKGPVNPKTNEQIYCGIPLGAERNSGYMREPVGVIKRFGYPWFRLVFGEDFNERKFDFADDMERMQREIGEDFTANNADLTALKEQGGKFIVYSGSADPAGPWADAVKYYNRVCEKMGGYENVKDFFKYFILPGKGHSTGGLGTNVTWGDEARSSMLDALRNWCENGKEPEYLVAAHIKRDEDNEKLKFIRRVYPYKADKKEGIGFPKSCDAKYLDFH